MTSLTKAKLFIGEFLRAGTVKYEDEVILIREENLDRIVKNFEGSPVIIGHEYVTNDNIDEIKVGTCGKVHLGGQLGFRAIDMIIDDDKGLQAINSGMSISCSLKPTETREGGTYNNVPYDREVINAEGLHMALVEDPRYEEAAIYSNSKSSDKEAKDNNLIKAAMFKIFNNSKKSDMDLENTNILINGESFKASDILENSKDGLVLKTDLLNNEKKEEEKEEKKDNEKEEEKEEKESKDNEAEKEEEKKDNEKEEEEKEEKNNASDTFKLSNGEEKTSKQLVEMANELVKMKEKKDEKEKNNSKLPLKEALDNAIKSASNEEVKESSYVSCKRSADLGSKLF